MMPINCAVLRPPVSPHPGAGARLTTTESDVAEKVELCSVTIVQLSNAFLNAKDPIEAPEVLENVATVTVSDLAPAGGVLYNTTVKMRLAALSEPTTVRVLRSLVIIDALTTRFPFTVSTAFGPSVRGLLTARLAFTVSKPFVLSVKGLLRVQLPVTLTPAFRVTGAATNTSPRIVPASRLWMQWSLVGRS